MQSQARINKGSGEGLVDFGAEPSQQDGFGAKPGQFNKVPKKIPENVPEGFGESRASFNEVLENGEGSRRSWDGQVQRGFK